MSVWAREAPHFGRHDTAGNGQAYCAGCGRGEARAATISRPRPTRCVPRVSCQSSDLRLSANASNAVRVRVRVLVRVSRPRRFTYVHAPSRSDGIAAGFGIAPVVLIDLSSDSDVSWSRRRSSLSCGCSGTVKRSISPILCTPFSLSAFTILPSDREDRHACMTCDQIRCGSPASSEWHRPGSR